VRATVVPGSPELARNEWDDLANLLVGLWSQDRGQRGENDEEKALGGSEQFWPLVEAIDRDRAWSRFSGGGGALWANVGELDGVGLAEHRAGAGSEHGRTLARPNWLKAGANRENQGHERMSHLGAELGVAWRGLR
jgi:hypothetical protein